MLAEYLRNGMDRERQAQREIMLPEWALELPRDRQRQILQAMRAATYTARMRHAEASREAADAILYGAKI